MGSVLDDSWFVVLETLEFLDKLITSPCSPILPSEQVLDNLRLCAPPTTLYAIDISRDPSQAFLSSALSNVPKSSRMLSVSLLSLSLCLFLSRALSPSQSQTRPRSCRLSYLALPAIFLTLQDVSLSHFVNALSRVSAQSLSSAVRFLKRSRSRFLSQSIPLLFFNIVKFGIHMVPRSRRVYSPSNCWWTPSQPIPRG